MRGKGKGRGMFTLIVGPAAPGEDFEEGKVGSLFWRRGAEGLDVGGLEEFCENVGVWGGGCLGDEVYSSAGGGCGFGEEDVGFEGVESFLLGLVHGGSS